ncbi:MAG: cytochrome b N-terminal domain-containing protein [Acidobacteria bacterium]|nr:cytochrome b N-terminal domain-containing protein [Acidobacteriota bacterium]
MATSKSSRARSRSPVIERPVRVARSAWRWFDDVTGVSQTVGPILTHVVPHARRSRWLFVFGSATLVAFLLQVVTGIALSSAYVTSSGQAYDSLHFITANTLGRIVRGLHYFGASAMIVLIGAHTIRVYLMGSYKYPRQMNWLTGTGLLLFTLLMAFTGQLLRWDQTGFWTAVVAAEQAGKAPIIGNWLARFVLAGSVPGGATLSRFFAAHVFFIPALMFVFIGVHLYLVLYNGISEPPAAGRPVDPRTYRAWYHRLLEREGLPFWPYAAWRDVVVGFGVVIVIATLAIALGPPELGRPPDPTLVAASPRPDWYFLWYFALLALMPKWSERWVILLGPLIFGLFLIFLPFVSPRGERHPLRRPWAIAIVICALAVIAHYSRMGHLAPWSPRMDAPPLPAEVVGTTSGPIAEGAQVFYDKGCEFCHLVSGYGGIRGPDLSNVGDRLTRDQMLTRILSGAENMPSYAGNMTAAEQEVLLAFLESRHQFQEGTPARPAAMR